MRDIQPRVWRDKREVTPFRSNSDFWFLELRVLVPRAAGFGSSSCGFWFIEPQLVAARRDDGNHNSSLDEPQPRVRGPTTPSSRNHNPEFEEPHPRVRGTTTPS